MKIAIKLIIISFTLLFINGCTATQRGASSENLYQDSKLQKTTGSVFGKKDKKSSIEVIELTYKDAVEAMYEVSTMAFPDIDHNDSLIDQLELGSDLIVHNRDFWMGDVKLRITAEVVSNLNNKDEYGIVFKTKADGVGANFSMMPGYASDRFYKSLDEYINDKGITKASYTNFKILKDKGITKKISASIPSTYFGFKKYIDDKSNLKPFEGIWVSETGKYTLGMVYTPKDHKHKYKAFVIESKYKNWKAGDIKAKFVKLRNNKLAAATIALRSKAEFTGTWKVEKELLEQISEPKMLLIKQYPESGYVDSSEFVSGVGTGWAISKDGIFVTNHHVIDGADKIYVGFKGKSEPARVLLSDKRIDLAVVQIINPKKEYKALSISNNTAENGSDISVIGYPLAFDLGDDPRIHEGIISAQSGISKDITRYQISANINPGNSGGPVIDTNANVVGVAVEKLNEGTSVNFAIKSNYVKSLLDQLDIKTHTNGQSNNSSSDIFKMYKSSILPIWTE
jgi:S1-C subfamily serine protease